MLNRVCLIGRLTKDPELRYTPTSVAVVNFTLAVDRNFKNAQGERDTDFIPCVAYRQTAEFVSNYLSKGKMTSVDGRIQIRTYTDQTNQKHWVTEVIVENVNSLSPKDSTQQGQDQQQSAQQQNQQQYRQPQGQQNNQGYAQGQNNQGYQQQPQGQAPPSAGYSQQPPQPTSYQPGSMPPPPSYQGQPPAGAFDTNQLGRQVSLDDDIPF